MSEVKRASRLKLRRLVINLLLSTLSIVFVIAVIEEVVRFSPSLWATGYVPSDNPKLVYELQRNYDIRSLKARISPQGLNDRTYTLQKTPGTFRIAVVGDSTSFGWQVQQEESFPKVMEQLLNAEGRTPIEVMNFSVPGYNLSQEQEQLSSIALGFHPDLVLLAACPNDPNIARFIKNRLTHSNFLFVKSYLVRYLAYRLDQYFTRTGSFGSAWLWTKERVFDLFYPDLPIFLTPGLEDTPQFDTRGLNPATVPPEYSEQIGWDNYRKHLREIVENLTQRSIAFVSAGYFNEQMRNIANELKLPFVVDFWSEMEKEGVVYEDMTLKTDPHMSPEGHKYVAKLIVRTLRSGNLVPD